MNDTWEILNKATIIITLLGALNATFKLAKSTTPYVTAYVSRTNKYMSKNNRFKKAMSLILPLFMIGLSFAFLVFELSKSDPVSRGDVFSIFLASASILIWLFAFVFYLGLRTVESTLERNSS